MLWFLIEVWDWDFIKKKVKLTCIKKWEKKRMKEKNLNKDKAKEETRYTLYEMVVLKYL